MRLSNDTTHSSSASQLNDNCRKIPELEQLRVPESLDTWLPIFTRLIKLPEAQQQAIRDEIEAHLRERIRDLMLGGMDENTALVQAISELGEAANLADRFTHAHTSQKRKRIMQLSLLGLATSTVVVGVIATSPGETKLIERSVYEPAAISDDLPDWFDTQSTTIDMDAVPLSSFIDWVSKLNDDMNMVVHWQQLSSFGIEKDWEFTLQLPNETSPRQILDLAVQQINGDIGHAEIAWWHGDGLLEIGSHDHLMTVTTELAFFDVGDILQDASVVYTYDQARLAMLSLITTMVSPDHWQVNGGNYATLELVGNGLFINAPAEMHAKVQWILDELAHASDQHRSDFSMPDDVSGMGGAGGGLGAGTGGAGGLPGGGMGGGGTSGLSGGGGMGGAGGGSR